MTDTRTRVSLSSGALSTCAPNSGSSAQDTVSCAVARGCHRRRVHGPLLATLWQRNSTAATVPTLSTVVFSMLCALLPRVVVPVDPAVMSGCAMRQIGCKADGGGTTPPSKRVLPYLACSGTPVSSNCFIPGADWTGGTPGTTAPHPPPMPAAMSGPNSVAFPAIRCIA